MRVLAPLSALLLIGLSHDHATAAEHPIDLKWAQLIPARVAPPPVAARTPFDLGSSRPPEAGEPPPPPDQEGRWMSRPRRSSSTPPAVVTEFEGKRVRIGGYVVPLDFDATSVKEFLLVPFVGACIHVPPPPANQIVYIKVDKGFELREMFDPVYVTGMMQTEVTFTGLAEAGYVIAAESVELRKP